ncbi:MAG: hypothetical protein CMH50_13355 [Myxococcales bacterium]|nr:hypothetical protein [Myxococcales bacterium]
MEFLSLLGAAFLGGLILNIMPCVLPVLFFKVQHLLEMSELDDREKRIDGIAYTAGILVAFLGFAVAVLLMKAAGQRVAQGMQMANPEFVAFLTALMLALGLNSLGVFEIHVGVNQGEQKRGFMGTFFSGIVAVLVATPCTAPFLGTAAAYAFAKETPAGATIGIFLMVGLGLAFPYLVVCFLRAAARLLPQPGPWMVTFKKLMGFTLLGAAVWLFGVIQEQVNVSSANWFLAFLLILGLGLWALDHFGGLLVSTTRRWTVRILVFAAVYGMGLTLRWVPAGQSDVQDLSAAVDCSQCGSVTNNSKAGAGQRTNCPKYKKTTKDEIHWVRYSEATRKQFMECGRPVFVDYTAKWCVSCQAFKASHIDIPKVRAIFAQTEVVPMRADLTKEPEDDELVAAIWEELENRFNRSGIPVWVVWHPDDYTELLPESIPPTNLPELLLAAGKEFPPSQ